MKRMNRPERQEERRKVVAENKAARAQRTPEQQLERLDALGFKAEKERARLHKQIAAHDAKAEDKAAKKQAKIDKAEKKKSTKRAKKDLKKGLK